MSTYVTTRSSVRPAEPRLALLDGLLVRPGRIARADDCARHVEARVVGQLGRLAQRGARLGNGPPPERLELLLGDSVEVLLRGSELLDVNHRPDLLRDAPSYVTNRRHRPPSEAPVARAGCSSGWAGLRARPCRTRDRGDGR